jgi:glycerophosphoryl diester phosphodiesterase
MLKSENALPPLQYPVAVAHRGANRVAPENTLPAYEAAIAAGCDYVEIDVRATRDGRLVLMHDRTVDRTTDGAGSVAEMDFAAIRALDAGVKRGDAFRGTRVPTMAEAVDLCHDRIRLYIDLKAAPVEAVLAELRRFDLLGEVVVYAGMDAHRELRRVAPNVAIMPGPGRALESAETLPALAAELHPETVDSHVRCWSAERVRQAHALGMRVIVDVMGETDTEEGMRAALAMGVDGIQADNIHLLMGVLGRGR